MILVENAESKNAERGKRRKEFKKGKCRKERYKVGKRRKKGRCR